MNESVYMIHQVEQPFYEFALSEGGLVQSNKMSGPDEVTACWIRGKFEHLIEFLLTSFDNHAHGWIRSLDLQWINNPTINACAYPGAERCYIGFAIGIVGRLRHIFYAVALHPLVFEDMPGSWKMEAGTEFRKWNNILVGLITKKKMNEATCALLETEIELLINEERKKLALELYEAAIDFIMVHEIQHFWLGHIYGLATFSKLGITELPSGKNSGTPYTLRRMVETHADIYASRHAFGLFEFLDKKERIVANTKWRTAIAILFMALEPNPVAYDQWDMEQYPHPHLRLASLFNWIQATISALDLDETEINSMTHGWVNVLSKIELLAKGKIAFPFREMLKEPEMYSKEIEQWAETYRANASMLDDGQITMLRHFNK